MTAPQAASGMTAVDAQLTKVQILKPFDGFENIYQGRAATTPIVMPCARDPRASRAGFDPNLGKGIDVPQGARVILWIPIAVSDDTVQQYAYRVVWRFHNINDYRDPGGIDVPRPPYHFPVQSPGAPDTSVPLSTQQRTLIPAAFRPVAFEQAEAGTANGRINVRPEEIVPDFAIANTVLPLLPDGTPMTLQQGVLDPAGNSTTAKSPIFVPVWFDAEGDEMFILVNRAAIVEGEENWDFDAQDIDRPFSNVYGTDFGEHPNFPRIGIYVQFGTTP